MIMFYENFSVILLNYRFNKDDIGSFRLYSDFSYLIDLLIKTSICGEIYPYLVERNIFVT